MAVVTAARRKPSVPQAVFKKVNQNLPFAKPVKLTAANTKAFQKLLLKNAATDPRQTAAMVNRLKDLIGESKIQLPKAPAGLPDNSVGLLLNPVINKLETMIGGEAPSAIGLMR